MRIDPDVRAVWRAYELRPDPVPTLDPDGEYLHRVWNASVYPMAKQMGITMKLPPVQPRSRLAHEAAQWARAQGKFEGYNAAVFRAFFERGQDIGQTDVLIDLAQSLGLEGDALREALESGAYTASVLDDERLAHDMVLTGVPAFVANRTVALPGVRSVGHLQQLVAHARNEHRTGS